MRGATSLLKRVRYLTLELNPLLAPKEKSLNLFNLLADAGFELFFPFTLERQSFQNYVYKTEIPIDLSWKKISFFN